MEFDSRTEDRMDRHFKLAVTRAQPAMMDLAATQRIHLTGCLSLLIWKGIGYIPLHYTPQQQLTGSINAMQESAGKESHADDFCVSGPRHVPRPNWRDIIRSSWKDENYKRAAMACFIQGVYVLELDRQENRGGEMALGPNWWKPFKYKLAEVLVDDGDSSIFGATLEWDRSAAACDLLVVRPSKAPRAVVCLRGTLFTKPTLRRDIHDDLRVFTRENLQGSCRFSRALDAVRRAAKKHGNGGSDVCVAGHSLGAALALQVGKALAEEEGICVEAHLFNPPSLSLPMALRSIGERFESLWGLVRGAVHTTRALILPATADGNRGEDGPSGGADRGDPQKWIPHLYVNDGDYICCNYTDGGDIGNAERMNNPAGGNRLAAKMFVVSKGSRKFLEAHGLRQWWSHDTEGVLGVSELLQRQLCLSSRPRPSDSS